MASIDPQIIGRISRGPFETVGRTETWAEQRTVAVNVVGKFTDLQNRVKPGDDMATLPNWFDGKVGVNWFVKTVDLTSPDGITGELRLNLVQCPEGKKKPYNITWDIAMEEVQMKLINHPSVIANCDIDVLMAWLDTPQGVRVGAKKKNGTTELVYRYYSYKVDENKQLTYTIEEVTDEWDIAFCQAVTQGIETYNKYLPVVIKNSFYLELPGVNYNTAHVITGGTLTEFTLPNAIGTFNEPPIKITGYTSKEGIWFKNIDKFTSQPDGSWVRTEGWVFTNDPRNLWIYQRTSDSKKIGQWGRGYSLGVGSGGLR